MVEKSEPFTSQSILLSDNAFLCYLGLSKFLIHLVTNLAGGYGYFRDELYYIACSDHMAWGYVDHPPFSIAALWLSRLLFGDSLFGLRLFPALAGAITVVLAGQMTRELGGKRFAQILASSSVIVAPLTLGTNSYFSMNSFDVLLWTLAFYTIILILKSDGQKQWIFLGLVLGLGLLNKISVLWLGAGLAIGLLLTHNRKLLLTPRVWLAAAIALFIFLPHVIWQAANGFPTVEFVKNATANKYVTVSPLEMVIQQASNMNPLTFLIWFSGLVYFLVSKSAKQFRILPLMYLAVFLILIVNRNSKAEYLGPMFPMRESYDEVVQTGTFKDDYCMPCENNMAVYICRNRRTPLKDDWAEFKHYEQIRRKLRKIIFRHFPDIREEISLFEGSGKTMKHMEIRSVNTIDEARIVTLMKLIKR